MPLLEIKQIRDMGLVEDDDRNESKYLNAMMIETDPEGYNSGRTYYFQADTKQKCRELVMTISKRVKEVQQKAQTKGLFKKIRHRVRNIFESRIFQNVFALLIIGVNF